jgi:hypothetical protein
MTWTVLGDEFADQCWKLSDGAWRLHVEGLIWSNRKYLDGRLPKDELGRWVKHPEFVPELLDIGWWSDEPDHLVINHHMPMQLSAEKAIARQEASRKNGRKGGRPPKPRNNPPGSEPTTNATEQPRNNPPGSEPTTNATEQPRNNPAGSENRNLEITQREGIGRDGQGLEEPTTYVSELNRESTQPDSVHLCSNGCGKPASGESHSPGECHECIQEMLQDLDASDGQAS